MAEDNRNDFEQTPPSDAEPMFDVINGKACWRDNQGNYRIQEAEQPKSEDEQYSKLDYDTRSAEKKHSLQFVGSGIGVFICLIIFLVVTIFYPNPYSISVLILFSILFVIYTFILPYQIKKYLKLKKLEEESWVCTIDENLEECEQQNADNEKTEQLRY